MKRNRRKRVTVDSLELLLDTICNTFGGVVFIALLVSILIQMSSNPTIAEATPATPEELADVVRIHGELSQQLAAARDERKSQSQILSALATSELRELLGEHDRQLEELIHTEAAAAEAAARNAEKAQRLAKLIADLKSLELRLQERRATLADLQKSLDEKIRQRSSDVKLSTVHPGGGRAEVPLILRYGRVYLWHQYDSGGFRRGLNVEDFIVVSETADEVTVRPHPLRGIALEDTDDCRQSLRNLLRRFSPQRHVISIVVRPDSYHVFHLLRDELVALGYEYRLFVTTEAGSIRDRGGSGKAVQ